MTRDDWDTLGMRGTQSRTTELHGAVAPADRVVRRIDPGPNPDPIVFGIFSVFELLLASVYTGIARRALDLAVETAGRRRSKKTGKAYSQDPDIRWRIADMALAYDALPPQLAALCRDVDELVDHGARWFSLLAGVKHRAVTMAKRVVDDAVLVAGGSSYFSGVGAVAALPRRARGAVPPVRPGVGALDGRDRVAGAARGLTPLARLRVAACADRRQPLRLDPGRSGARRIRPILRRTQLTRRIA